MGTYDCFSPHYGLTYSLAYRTSLSATITHVILAFGCFYKLGGPFCGCLCHRSPAIWGLFLGHLIFGSSQLGSRTMALGIQNIGTSRGPSVLSVLGI